MESKVCKAAAVYVRISDDKAGEGLGVARQKKDCLALAGQRGWTVAEVYEDNDISASTGKHRPAYERMMADLKSGERDGIIAFAPDRLTRNIREMADLLELNVPADTVSGAMDLTTPGGRAMAGFGLIMARQEVEQKSLRHKAQIRQTAEAGLPTTHKRPFGWTTAEMTTLHPVEAPALQKAAADLLVGSSVRSIVVHWNQSGLTTSTGGTWHSMTVKQALSRWSNAAIPQLQGEPLHDVQGQWVPILDKPTLEALRNMLNGGSVPKAVRKYLLSTVLVCGKCGRTLRGSSGRYKCIGTLEGMCDISVMPKVADDVAVTYTVNRLAALGGADLGGTVSQQRAEVEQALANIGTERAEVIALGSDQIDGKSRLAWLKKLHLNEVALQAQRDAMTTNGALSGLIAGLTPYVTQGKASFGQAVENRKAVRENWDNLDPSQQRLVIRSFGNYTVMPGGRGAARIVIQDLHPDLNVLDVA